MTLSEPTRIDIVAEAPDGTIVLGIVVSGWADPAVRRDQLTLKLCAYLKYIHSAQYEARFGNRDVTIHLVTDTEPPSDVTELLEATEAASGIPIRLQRLGAGGAAEPVGTSRSEPRTIGRTPAQTKRPERVGAGSPPSDPNGAPRGLPKNVAVETPTTATLSQLQEMNRILSAAEGRRRAEAHAHARLRRVQTTFAIIGLSVGVIAGIFTWDRSGSVALVIFVFVMTNFIISRGVADVITDRKKVQRAVYFALTPVLATGLLWLSWQQWQIMWLAVLIGLVGGATLSGILGLLLFPSVHQEEQRDTSRRNKEAFGRRWRGGGRA